MFENGISKGVFLPEILYFGKVIRTGGYELHKHDFMEVTYVFNGEGKYILDNEEHAVQMGDIILVNPGVEHASVMKNKDSSLVLFTFCFDNFCLDGMPENMIIMPEDKYVIHSDASLQKSIELYMNNGWLERNRRDIGMSVVLRNYLSLMIVEILRFAYSKKIDLSQEEKPLLECYNKAYLVDYIRKYIDKNYSSEITLEKLGKEVNLSPIYLSKIFKASTGVTPVHYLIQIRLAIARTMIQRDPSLNIGEVAKMVGYNDVCHFSKMFKKKFGVSPGFYKK